jgi:nucleoside-diphosphate-sugar epimerase
MARWGISPVVGPEDAYWPALWVDDAASAFVAALTATPSGVYDVVDNRPLTRAELRRAVATALGRPSWRLPVFLQRLVLGDLAESLSRSVRVTNRGFVEATGWQPAVPDALAGWRLMAARSSGKT